MNVSYSRYHRDKDYLANENLFKNIFQKRFNILNKFVKGGKVLEIGCSNGVFLDIFKVPTSPRLRGAQWETWGIEPSENGLIAKKKGHKIILNFFENTELPEKYFDLVIMNHTLEHVDDPLVVIRKIHRLLKTDGILFVDVPNFGSLLSKIMGKRWPYLLPLEHKSQFTKETLTKLFVNANFEVLHWESRSGIFEYANPLLEIKRKRFILDILALPYSLVATLLNMGDSMSLVGRKNK